MTASFTATALVGDRVLVQGEDQFGTTGRTVVDGSQWASINQHKEYDQATEAFDAAVEAFFAPLTEAADKLDEALAGKPDDSTSYVVLHEAVEATPGQAGQLVKLTPDSIVLRLVEAGSFDRLVWVDGNLEVLAAS